MREKRDQRGTLALITLSAVFVYAYVLLFSAGAGAEMPPWMVAVASLVTGHYFGTRESESRQQAVSDLVAELERRAALPNGHEIEGQAHAAP